MKTKCQNLIKSTRLLCTCVIRKGSKRDDDSILYLYEKAKIKNDKIEIVFMDFILTNIKYNYIVVEGEGVQQSKGERHGRSSVLG